MQARSHGRRDAAADRSHRWDGAKSERNGCDCGCSAQVTMWHSLSPCFSRMVPHCVGRLQGSATRESPCRFRLTSGWAYPLREKVRRDFP